MFRNLRYDLNRVMENDPAARSKIEVFLLYPTIHAMIAYRIAHFLYTKKSSSNWFITSIVLAASSNK